MPKKKTQRRSLTTASLLNVFRLLLFVLPVVAVVLYMGSTVLIHNEETVSVQEKEDGSSVVSIRNNGDFSEMRFYPQETDATFTIDFNDHSGVGDRKSVNIALRNGIQNNFTQSQQQEYDGQQYMVYAKSGVDVSTLNINNIQEIKNNYTLATYNVSETDIRSLLCNTLCGEQRFPGVVFGNARIISYVNNANLSYSIRAINTIGEKQQYTIRLYDAESLVEETPITLFPFEERNIPLQYDLLYPGNYTVVIDTTKDVNTAIDNSSTRFGFYKGIDIALSERIPLYTDSPQYEFDSKKGSVDGSYGAVSTEHVPLDQQVFFSSTRSVSNSEEFFAMNVHGIDRIEHDTPIDTIAQYDVVLAELSRPYIAIDVSQFVDEETFEFTLTGADLQDIDIEFVR